MSLQNHLIAPNKIILNNTAQYITTTLGYTLTDLLVITDSRDFKKYALTKEKAIFYLADVNLLPWTVNNLKWAIALYKQNIISIYYLELKKFLCDTIQGYPAQFILDYLQTIKQTQLNNDL